MVSCWLPRSFNDSLLQLYATVTKQDVVMNNYVVRAKTLDDTKYIIYIYIYIMVYAPKQNPKAPGLAVVGFKA